jgi:Na+-transporting NADH:ubiquinone oxidoreductase subunit NqrB
LLLLLLLLFLLPLMMMMMTDVAYDDACYHSVLNAVSYLKRKKLNLYRALENRMLREIFGPERRKY